MLASAMPRKIAVKAGPPPTLVVEYDDHHSDGIRTDIRRKAIRLHKLASCAVKQLLFAWTLPTKVKRNCCCCRLGCCCCCSDGLHQTCKDVYCCSQRPRCCLASLSRSSYRLGDIIMSRAPLLETAFPGPFSAASFPGLITWGRS